MEIGNQLSYSGCTIIINVCVTVSSVRVTFSVVNIGPINSLYQTFLQARSHNEANEAVASPKISKKNLPQMKNS